jgi:hypothetical protein
LLNKKIMRKLIPAPIIAILSDVIPSTETHASIDSLFMYAGAPGDPPAESKTVKVQTWLYRVNKDENIDPMQVLGLLIEKYMEVDDDPSNLLSQNGIERKTKIERALQRAELQYVKGGKIIGPVSSPSRTLEQLIRTCDMASINEEFTRALVTVETKPREAVSAASNILESLCKIYIEEERLEMPKKQDLQPVWAVVREDLGFDPGRVEDRDLKEILSGLIALVNGIGALRTHASSAHGAGTHGYALEPRHARLAIHGAHTVVTFVLESWDKKRSNGKR